MAEVYHFLESEPNLLSVPCKESEPKVENVSVEESEP
jgi:hypothetical protein